ncbi:MAG: hypothetical protein FJW90_07520 [Actinobacteria bacterium]|nr:hypothetical protein [Actinomycetota bacterium]
MRKLLTAATTLLICLGTAGSAAAATPRGFYGIVPAADPTEAEFTRMADGKVGTLRLNFSWESVQPTGPGSFDWARYDSLIGQAAQSGIMVLPTIYGSPSWAAAKPQYPPQGARLADFRTFVQAAADRYGPSGDFWSLNPQLPRREIFDWQLWNEVNSPSFWLPTPNPKQYKQLALAARAGLDAAAPGTRLVMAGLFLTPRVKNGVFLTKYLAGLYKLGGKNLFDSVSMHPYSPTPRRALNAIEQVRALLGELKDKRKPLWLTEVGWSTGGTKTPLTVSLKVQAKYLRETFKLAAANRKRYRIAGVVWYSLRDVPGPVWFNSTGLFTASGAAKPSWHAFAALTGGIP